MRELLTTIGELLTDLPPRLIGLAVVVGITGALAAAWFF